MDFLGCPICHEHLNKIDNSYKCINNHLYDISKKGYLNLLLNKDKNTNNPGDDKDCLEARRLFLNKGYYNVISQNVIDLINKYKDKPSIIDLGCGEGYYTNNIFENVKDAKIVGSDISKEGISMACKYTKDITWVVANNKNIPALDHSVDVVVAMFTVINLDEVKRVLKKDGIIIHVTSGTNHLIELRKSIYKDVVIKDDNHMNLNLDLIESKNINEIININNKEDLTNLLKMTPHYYRIKKDNISIDINKLTIDVNIKVYKNDK